MQRARRSDPRRSRGGPGLAGGRPLHRRRDPLVRVRSARADPRGKHSARLARLLAVRDDIKVASTRERLWQAAARLVPPENAGAFNQALMDLGALVCTPREPACLVCPRLKALPGSTAWPARSPAADDPQAASPGGHRSGGCPGAPGTGPDPRARARGSLGAILGIPDGAPAKGSIRPADHRARPAICKNRSSASRESPPGSAPSQNDRLQRHQAPGEAVRASGRGAFGRRHARARASWPLAGSSPTSSAITHSARPDDA